MKRLQKLYAQFRSLLWKNLKFKYYLVNYASLLIPKSLYHKKLAKELTYLSQYDKASILQRVNYYNRINNKFSLENFEVLKNYKYRSQCKNYFFDLYQTTKYFANISKINYDFGDVIEVPNEPAFVKSRPLVHNAENAVLMKLNKVRHFVFVDDNRAFEAKKFKVLFRGNVYPHQTSRVVLIDKYHNHPLCDVEHVNEIEDSSIQKGEKLSLYEHLEYQFILSLEGNDVATNLKWIMSSNSIAVMPKPKYETWFMEGSLIPDYHYILVKDDFSDLVEKITYYHQNLDKAKVIVKNANEYVAQFKDKKRERLISLMVMEKFFKLQNK